MTPFELNKAIAKYLFPTANSIERWSEKDDSVAIVVPDPDLDDVCHKFDYRNYNDLMPLVEKYGISLYAPPHLNNGLWYTEDHMEKISTRNKDLQRAAAECLLKVLQNKEVNSK